MAKELGVGIIGCGNISTTYFSLSPLFKGLKVLACADLNRSAAELRAEEFGVKAQSIEELLANDEIDVVVNLTIPAAHFEVSKAILEAGKHVYSEKPLVLSLEEGEELRRIAKEKNLATLFEMAAIVFKQDSRLRLWLVGDGPYRSECVRMARSLGIGDRIKFVGFVPREDVDKYYAASDLFVFSSITETQGLVVQEAMTYSLPAVAILGGGASESIIDGENGFAVKNDAATFAAQVLEIVNDETLLAALSDGAQRSSRMVGTEAMCDRVIEVYRQAISDRHREPVRESVNV